MANSDPIYAFDGEFRFLSNFYPSEIRFEGMTFQTVEHAFQAAKTVDRERREWIRLSNTPGIAKRRGRKIQLRPHWEGIKIDVMRLLLREKFYGAPGLAGKLRATAGRELIEGNTWGDHFWGICNNHGYNHLGILLMEIRAELEEEEHAGQPIE